MNDSIFFSLYDDRMTEAIKVIQESIAHLQKVSQALIDTQEAYRDTLPCNIPAQPLRAENRPKKAARRKSKPCTDKASGQKQFKQAPQVFSDIEAKYGIRLNTKSRRFILQYAGVSVLPCSAVSEKHKGHYNYIRSVDIPTIERAALLFIRQ